MKLSKKFIEEINWCRVHQFVLARKFGFHPTSLSHLKSGYNVPKKDDPRLIKLGKHLGLKESELFEGT